jgi:hypothetical protein
MAGGVQTARKTAVAPPSATSTAISAAQFPCVGDETRLPAYGAGFR